MRCETREHPSPAKTKKPAMKRAIQYCCSRRRVSRCGRSLIAMAPRATDTSHKDGRLALVSRRPHCTALANTRRLLNGELFAVFVLNPARGLPTSRPSLPCGRIAVLWSDLRTRACRSTISAGRREYILRRKVELRDEFTDTRQSGRDFAAARVFDSLVERFALFQQVFVAGVLVHGHIHEWGRLRYRRGVDYQEPTRVRPPILEYYNSCSGH